MLSDLEGPVHDKHEEAEVCEDEGGGEEELPLVEHVALQLNIQHHHKKELLSLEDKY